jgi:hypothetical protein
MDPLSRKLFSTGSPARERLAQMGGIMASSPALAATVQRFNNGGSVGELEYVVVIPGVTDRNGMRVRGSTLEAIGRQNPELLQRSRVMDRESAQQSGINVDRLRPGDAILMRTLGPAPAAPAAPAPRPIAGPAPDPMGMFGENMQFDGGPASPRPPAPSLGPRTRAEELLQQQLPAPGGPGPGVMDMFSENLDPSGGAMPTPPRTPAEEIGLDPGPVPMLGTSDMARIQTAQGLFPSLDMPIEEDRAAQQAGDVLRTERRAARAGAAGESLRRDAETAAGAGQPDVAAELLAEAERADEEARRLSGSPTEERLPSETLLDETPPEEPVPAEEVSGEDTPAGGGTTGETPGGGTPDPLTAAADQAAADLRTFFGIEAPSRAPGSRRERVEQELELIREVFGDRTRDQARDRAMNLAMIGFAIAAGQSPNALTNIAQGALAGTQAMARAQAAAQEREDEQRMMAYRNVVDEDQETRRLSQAMGMERFRASLRGRDSAFGTITHPLNQWFTSRNQLDQQARDPASDLWSQLQQMPEAERAPYLDNLAFERVMAGFGSMTPEVQQLQLALRSGQLGGAFTESTAGQGSGTLPVVTTRAEYDSLPSGAEFIQNGQRRRKP